LKPARISFASPFENWVWGYVSGRLIKNQPDPKAKAAKPEDFVEMRFVKELDESGFIDDLYKNRKR
jgi:hypothetical protein